MRSLGGWWRGNAGKLNQFSTALTVVPSPPFVGLFWNSSPSKPLIQRKALPSALLLVFATPNAIDPAVEMSRRGAHNRASGLSSQSIVSASTSSLSLRIIRLAMRMSSFSAIS